MNTLLRKKHHTLNFPKLQELLLYLNFFYVILEIT